MSYFVAALGFTALAACTQTTTAPTTTASLPEIAPPSLPTLAPYHEAPALGLSCVPYARQRTGVNLRGDAYTWWDHAAGLYARGNQPATGAILVLGQSTRLGSGHVAVVNRVIGPRQILVDHANWIPDEVVTNMPVIDVSPGNDWSELRFWNDPSRTYGAIYLASGFIYTTDALSPQPPISPPVAPPDIPNSDQPTVIISGSGVSIGDP